MRRLVIFVIITLGLVDLARAGTQTQELILPAVFNGYVAAPLHYQTTVRIVNLSAAPAEVTFEAYTNDGVPIRVFQLFPIALTGTKTVFQIGPFGSVEAFTAEDVPSLRGWARVTADSSVRVQVTAEVALIDAPVGPHPICYRPSTEIVMSVQIAAVTPATKFSGFAVIRPNRKSIYALVNPSPTQTAEVFLSLLDTAGALVASTTVLLPPQGQIIAALPDLLPSAPSDFMGSLRVTGNMPVGVGAGNQLYPDGRVTSLAVTPNAAAACIQVLAPARNPLTGECRVFPTPCDVPEGWELGGSCD